MVIDEPLRIAELQGLSGREPERIRRPVHWVIDLHVHGCPLQFSPTTAISKSGRSGMAGLRGKLLLMLCLYHMQVTDGKIQSVCTNQHNWLPDFLIGPAAELFPRGADGAQSVTDRKRRLTWRLLFEASSRFQQIPRSTTSDYGAVALPERCLPRFDAILLCQSKTSKSGNLCLRRSRRAKSFSPFASPGGPADSGHASPPMVGRSRSLGCVAVGPLAVTARRR